MPAIVHIETIVPDFRYSQSEIGERMKTLTQDRRAKQYIGGIYADSGIEFRHSVLSDFSITAGQAEGSERALKSMPTGSRNQIFCDESKKLISKLAKKTFQNFKGFAPSEITHVITVSCTGFYNPGPDLQLVTELGLANSVERYHLGFMGCYAAFPALRLANQFCQNNPSAKVLILCLELCTLHFQNDENLDVLLANSIFSDGAAIALVQNNPVEGTPHIGLERFSSQILFQAEKDMAWTIGNHGFEMVLSKYIPKIIAANIKQLVEDDLAPQNLALKNIDTWAVHPGGKSILDKVEESLGLNGVQLEASRNTLKMYGNMSSATIIFVLQKILTETKSTAQTIYGMAFGPGLSIESALMKFNSGAK